MGARIFLLKRIFLPLPTQAAGPALGEPEAGDSKKAAGGVCCLCLEPCRHASCTPCGHLYCWTCIQRWLRVRPQCPTCRHPVASTGDVVPLVNAPS